MSNLAAPERQSMQETLFIKALQQRDKKSKDQSHETERRNRKT
jgi:hypothetical protein